MNGVARDQWMRAVKAWTPDSRDRAYKFTLVSLGTVMTPDGVISKPREKLIAATGLPSERSMERHLAFAVRNGWLVHVRKGVKRTACARYEAAIPNADHPPLTAADELATIRRARRQVRHSDGTFGTTQRRPKSVPQQARPSAVHLRVVHARPSAVDDGHKNLRVKAQARSYTTVSAPVTDQREQPRGGLTMDNPKTGARGRHASTASSPRPVLADLRFVPSPAGNWGAA